MNTTKEQLAARLNGREMGNEIDEAEQAEAKAAGLVVLCGASDDLAEFYGAFRDEGDCYDGGDLWVDRNGLVPDEDQLDDPEEIVAARGRRERAKVIHAIWDQEGYSWTYETAIPYATFDVLEEGQKYCRGIVFLIDDL